MRFTKLLAVLIAGAIPWESAWAGEPASVAELADLPAPALKARLLGDLGAVLDVRPDLPAFLGSGPTSKLFLVTKPHVVVTPTVCVADVIRPEFDPPMIHMGGPEGDVPRRIVGLSAFSLYWVAPSEPLGRSQADCASLDVASDHFFLADNELAAALGYAALEATIRNAPAGRFEVACPLDRSLSQAACLTILGSLELRKLTSVASCETASLDLMCVDLEVGDWTLRVYGTFQGTRFNAASVSLRRNPAEVSGYSIPFSR